MGMTQRHGGALPTREVDHRPWNASIARLRLVDDLSQVHRIKGGKHLSTLLWIPGIVLAAVDSEEQIETAVQDLVDALGASGTSQGVLLLMPGIKWTRRPATATLAKKRIRVENLLGIKSDELAGLEGAAWLEKASHLWLTREGRESGERLRKRAASQAGTRESGMSN